MFQENLMSPTKRYTYKEGIARIDDALDKEFWLEASWIIYAMFEDRCNSLLEKSGGPIPPPKNGFVSINKKITELKTRAATNQFLNQVNHLSGMLQELYDWKEDRNPIMHDLVDLPKDWSIINADAEKLARDGRDLLGRFTAAAMKVRKKYVKAGNTT
jgi:hypothetical protein